MTRDECLNADRRDPLAEHRQSFVLPEGVLYFDGNSLGALPGTTASAVAHVIEREWGAQLIRAWNDAGWMDAPRRVGAKIARLIARTKCCAPTLFLRLVEERCADQGLQLVTPRDASDRGSQVCLAHEHAWPVMQALIARGVIGDYRENHDGPGILRFGFAPLYLRFVDVWDAVDALRDILATRAWDQPGFQQRKRVT